LWFYVMNRRLLEVVGYDANRINFDPARREQLIRRYQLDQRSKSSQSGTPEERTA
jgi:alkane 1-monooxygenase